MAENNAVQMEDLPSNFRASPPKGQGANHVFPPRDDNMCEEVEKFEKREIIKALRDSNFVKQRASRMLGITPRQLSYRIKKYAIDIRKI